MRTKIKNNDYFKKYIQFQDDSAKEFIELYEENKKTWDSKTVKSNDSDIFSYLFHKLFAQYSAGEDIAAFNETFLQALDYMDKSWKDAESFKYAKYPDPYFTISQFWEILSMLSIGYLLNTEEQNFKRLVRIRDIIPEGDQILDFIINARAKRPLEDHLMETDKYSGLAGVIREEDKAESGKKLKEYVLKKWYSDNKKNYWYGYHSHKFDIYFGYWCFAAGAIAKIKQLDDADLKNNEYYPYDLVHWKD